MNDSSDVIIIGGGVVGMTTAYRLAEAGLSVRVLERGRCGQEASWAGAGMLATGSWHRTDGLAVLQRKAPQQHQQLAHELLERTGISAEFVHCKSIDLFFEDHQRENAEAESRAAEKSGHRLPNGQPIVATLTAEQVREKEPAITTKILGGQYHPDTAQIRNPRLMKALLISCRAAGVVIEEGVTVHRLVRQADRVTGVRSTAGDHLASHVVLTAGAWSGQLDDRLAQMLPVYPVRGQIVLLEMPKPPFRHVLDRGKCYLVPRLDGKIVVGATEEHKSGFVKMNTADGIAGLLNLAVRMVPVLKDARILKTWSGLRPGTPDRWPYIGPVPGFDGLIAATGHFRSGLALAPATADVVRDLITTGKTDADLSRAKPGREIRKRK